ncbi:KTSC domain-containing protein [Acholeplasma laidlawii]|uniref:KTSC domain-containing protein n=2 Tax=Acholeplasma laidlawii TaxID=2148 RepID=A9NH33_ACHLI|nr:KTSC domain-containing protein [Acholeplasma laidlawii]ABX81663.1 conserved hypothetical protein [Acholeplasma laidlawii PG-8A]NWH09761.1 KTSC domain-containing protein [Acholeplasma laidlawii]NWH11151.1 KTSC domain-containing protein [Acholeplasma laidlawii]NWH13438.1 KTSC domain-containing protein [Acholeplasma laidlawii]NWH14583.1 KTSC domain-containing protein [Acholeplasma laidlawii]
MNMKYVQSSHIDSVGYDSDTGLLVFEFKDGSVYEYLEVPEYVHQELLSADSIGRYAHQNIYNTYRSNKVR